MMPNFSIDTQAAPPSVGDCLDKDAVSECLEETDTTETEEHEDAEQDVLSNESSTGSLVLNILKTIFALLLILLLIYLLIRFLSKRNKLFNQVKTLENLGGISLGQNKSIQIVRIGDKAYLVGVGDNVELLQEIDDENIINELLQSNDQSDFQVNNFVQTIFKQKTSNSSKPSDEPQHKFKNLFSNELEKLKENRETVKNQRKKKEDHHE
jgi:flagellar protein FliO/FliZ